MTWTLKGTWDWSVSGNTASPIAFTGLSGAQDLLIIARDVTLSSSGILGVQLSIDNGSSYYSTSGDYRSITDAGVSGTPTQDVDQIRMYSTAATAVRSASKIILATSISGIPKHDVPSESGRRHRFLASLAPITALRVLASGGGNMTGGFIYVLGRY